MSNPDKIKDLMATVKISVESGKYLDTRHGLERQTERLITRPEVLFVLRNGHHEKKKDKWDAHYLAWNYAVRGKTLDKRELRVVISFDENGMLIITAIELR